MATVQNDPGQQTKISQKPVEQPNPKSAARTLLPTDDVTPPGNPGKGLRPMIPPTPFKGI